MGVFTWFVNARINFLILYLICSFFPLLVNKNVLCIIKFVIFAKLQIKPRENSLLFNVYFKCVYPPFFLNSRHFQKKLEDLYLILKIHTLSLTDE